MIDLHVALGDYLQTRRALGTQLQGWPESFLRQLVDFLIAQESDVITTALALRWTFLSVGLQPDTYARRPGLVCAFSCWLQATDPRTDEIPPPRPIPAPHRRPTPYIYRHEEVAALIAQASRLNHGCGLRGATFETLIGLLAATGLRPGQPSRSGHGPRLQDLRHTFATRQLIARYRAGLDVNRLMPRLATYLGHVGPSETYWYIQAVPQLFALASERLVVPEGDPP